MTLLQDSLLGKICSSLESMDNRHSGHNEEFEILFNAYDMVMTHIENLEAKVFPNLQSDLRKLHRVIGGNEAILSNPLDQRKREPPKKD
jgi:hypothetical protein